MNRPGTTDQISSDIEITPALRPNSFAEFVGQSRVVSNLQLAIQAAKLREEPIEHLLLSGPPGLGKTTLANIVASEMKARLISTSGPALERPGDLMGILTNLSSGDVLFIDEIHRLSRSVEEYLYPAMEDYAVDFVLDRGAYARTVRLKIPRFTLVGATTRSGLMTSPLRSRFGLLFHLELYSTSELMEVINRAAIKLGINIKEDAAELLASRSRGTPRVAVRMLRRARDYAQVGGSKILDAAIADKALSLLGVDKWGLDNLDRRFLTVLIEAYGGGPAGLNALAASLGEEEDTLADVMEPFLLSRGFISRTQRGRIATPAAYEMLGKDQNTSQSALGMFDEKEES